jgi:putative FmdB family regulatory protein
MPIYEYSCTRCGHQLEVLQKMRDEPLQECPSCHEKTLKKQMSVAAFHLKGSGWYNGNHSQPSCETGSCATGSCCPAVND